jgi:DMSO/TMAO reductase YedYZ molybdopterin-dependent catalytic subunit
MSEARKLDRRGFLARGLAAVSTALLGGCEELSDQDWVKRILDSGETLTRITQQALLSPQFGEHRHGGRSYESIGLEDAFHEQTILAYEMNGQTLPVPHGSPLRLRVEGQLGYKMAKYVIRMEAVASLSVIRGGRGGFWEDLGYEWYAGI